MGIKKILIAEDDNVLYSLYVLILKNEPYQLIRAFNGIEVLKLTAEISDISLIIMDMIMPEMDGFEAIDCLRQRKINIPIIGVSALSSEVEQQKIRTSGCDAIITKPFKRDVLLNTIAQLITS